jgi:hypothetical protein
MLLFRPDFIGAGDLTGVSLLAFAVVAHVCGSALFAIYSNEVRRRLPYVGEQQGKTSTCPAALRARLGQTLNRASFSYS